jgi:hypothetical protein
LFVLGERHQAVADVAGGKHSEIASQAAGTASLISDGDDGGKPGDFRSKLSGAGGLRNVVLQSAKDCG